MGQYVCDCSCFVVIRDVNSAALLYSLPFLAGPGLPDELKART